MGLLILPVCEAWSKYQKRSYLNHSHNYCYLDCTVKILHYLHNLMQTHIQGNSDVVPENSDLFVTVDHLITEGNSDPHKP